MTRLSNDALINESTQNSPGKQGVGHKLNILERKSQMTARSPTPSLVDIAVGPISRVDLVFELTVRR